MTSRRFRSWKLQGPGEGSLDGFSSPFLAGRGMCVPCMRVCVCVCPQRAAASGLTNRPPFCDHRLLLPAPHTSFLRDFTPTGRSFVRQGSARYPPRWERGQRVEEKKTSPENREFWARSPSPHDWETLRPRGLCLATSGSRWSHLKTRLIILRANPHRDPRGEWLQVTKELH